MPAFNRIWAFAFSREEGIWLLTESLESGPQAGSRGVRSAQRLPACRELSRNRRGDLVPCKAYAPRRSTQQLPVYVFASGTTWLRLPPCFILRHSML